MIKLAIQRSRELNFVGKDNASYIEGSGFKFRTPQKRKKKNSQCNMYIVATWKLSLVSLALWISSLTIHFHKLESKCNISDDFKYCNWPPNQHETF